MIYPILGNVDSVKTQRETMRPNPQLRDLKQDIVLEAVRRIIKKERSSNPLYKKLYKKNKSLTHIDVDIDWNDVVVETVQTSNPKIDNDPDKAEVLCQTTFKNKTNKEQENNFSTSRETTQSISVDVTKGWCYSKEMGFSLGLPYELGELSAQFGEEITFEKTKGTFNEKTLTWQADTRLLVPAQSQIKASMSVTSKTARITYDREYKLRGQVKVQVLDSSDNNSIKAFFSMPLHEAVKSLREAKDYSIPLVLEDDSLVLPFKGVLTLSYAVDQQIKVESQELDRED